MAERDDELVVLRGRQRYVHIFADDDDKTLVATGVLQTIDVGPADFFNLGGTLPRHFADGDYWIELDDDGTRWGPVEMTAERPSDMPPSGRKRVPNEGRPGKPRAFGERAL